MIEPVWVEKEALLLLHGKTLRSNTVHAEWRAAALQIKTVLTRIFPCRRQAAVQQQRPSIEQSVEFGIKLSTF
jgi:hypothetical protein